MSTPHATYRLQFRCDMTFDRAAALAPYLARLGISHLYASPIFAAVPGSTHGYDVIDHNRLDPALGGAEGFARMSEALKREGLGLVVDIVPNHMGASPENPWWRDVLEWGWASRYADHFDIDWGAGSLSLPVLGKTYGESLDAGELGLGWHPGWHRLVITYYDNSFPLDPRTLGPLIRRIGAEDIADAFAHAAPEAGDAPWHQLAERSQRPQVQAALAAASADRELVHGIHELQSYRLMYWRAGRDSLTYRRFFEITGLAGVRVEDPAVFDDVHRLVLDLVAEGAVDGVRIDHVDGLADPKGYLVRLRAALDARRPGVPIWVEKILEPGEPLRPDWPVAGTTGYEFITALARLLTSEQNTEALDEAYAAFTGASADYAAALGEAKQLILVNNLAGELETLTLQALALAAPDLTARDYGADTLRQSIAGLLSGFHVYRPYVDADGPSEADLAFIEEARAAADAAIYPEDTGPVEFIVRLLTLDVPPEQREEALQFVRRFQQTSGPLMAKAVEDTLFYRFNRLIALNEVGGDPDRVGGGAPVFHELMAERASAQRHGLSATATHDTKRGEDARTRLYAIGEVPGEWAAAVGHWWHILTPVRAELDSGPAPEPALEWALYQALLGVWPMDLAAGDEAGLAALAERFLPFVEKAIREAKLRTSWTRADEDYEAAVRRFASALFDAERRGFRETFLAVCRPFFLAGALGGLAQTLLKLAAPGVPDVYQGTERWDFSMVDPDNRRPVDFHTYAAEHDALMSAAPAELVADWRSGRIKQRLVAAGLTARHANPRLFAEGSYVPIEAEGERAGSLVAFARLLDDAAALAVAPRAPFAQAHDRDEPMVPPERWDGTSLAIPPALAGRTLADTITGARVTLRPTHPVGEILAAFPVALLAG